MPSLAAIVGTPQADRTVLEFSQANAVEAWSLRAASWRGTWDPLDPAFLPRFDWRSALTGELARANLSFDWRRRTGSGWLAADIHARLAQATLADGINGVRYDFQASKIVPDTVFSQRLRESSFGAALRWSAPAHSLQASFRGNGRDAEAGATGERGELKLFREDRLDESAFALTGSTRFALPGGIRAEAGARYDWYHATVRSDIAARAGDTAAQGLATHLRLSARAPFVDELFVKLAQGGEPGAMADPRNGAPVARLDPARRRDTIEIGFRRRLPLGIETTVSMFRAKSDLELLLAGENAITEFSRPTVRQGVQAQARYEPAKWLTLDFQASALHARYADGAGEYVAGAAERNASATATLRLPARWTAGLTVNYLGKRAGVDEVGSLRDSTFVGARFTRKVSKDTRISLDLVNMLDQKLQDVDYFSASRLPNNAAEPRGVRLRLRTTF